MEKERIELRLDRVKDLFNKRNYVYQAYIKEKGKNLYLVISIHKNKKRELKKDLYEFLDNESLYAVEDYYEEMTDIFLYKCKIKEQSKYWKYSKNGMKMILHTAFGIFNNQTNYIGSGNVIANTMYGKYIRAINDIECNGRNYEKGYLRNVDLETFDLPNELKEYIDTIKEQFVLYQFHYYKNNKQIVIGYILDINKDFKIFNVLDSQKAISVLNTCKNILCEK